jgi:hypothetical protein
MPEADFGLGNDALAADRRERRLDAKPSLEKFAAPKQEITPWQERATKPSD